jgi:hypothetical protein
MDAACFFQFENAGKNTLITRDIRHFTEQIGGLNEDYGGI